MGEYDRNNYLAVIKVRDNITDPEYLDYCIRTDMDFSVEEYYGFKREHPMPTHPVPLKALDFICTYKDGKMKPDRWDYNYRKIFDDDTPRLIVSILAQPGQDESIKKRRFYSVDFKNEWYCPVWEMKGKLSIPVTISMSEKKMVLPDYLFSMTFYFSKSLKNIYPFIEEFVKDFCNALPTDYGKIIDQSTMETIFDVSCVKSV